MITRYHETVQKCPKTVACSLSIVSDFNWISIETLIYKVCQRILWKKKDLIFAKLKLNCQYIAVILDISCSKSFSNYRYIAYSFIGALWHNEISYKPRWYITYSIICYGLFGSTIISPFFFSKLNHDLIPFAAKYLRYFLLYFSLRFIF